jgi:hypothetical protein
MIPPLYNPVPGYIQSANWSRPSGNTDFKVTSPFGYRDLNGDGDTTDPGEFHTGVDLGNRACGDDIKAALAGTVTFSGTKPGLNGQPANVIRIDHGNGLVTEYVHLQDRLVAKGKVVAADQLIGHCGKTGASACHLHFVTIVNGVKQDPMPLLWQSKRGHAVSKDVLFRATAGTTGTTTKGPIYATISSGGLIRRGSDGKDLGDYLANRALRQPVVGANYTLAGGTNNLWLPHQLDVMVFVAKPLILVA